MKITSTTLDTFRTEFNNTVKELAEKHNVQIELGTMRYNSTSFKATLNVSNVQITESGDILSKEAQDYLELTKRGWLPYSELPELGAKFYSGGKEFTIVGAKPRSSKYPILAKQVDKGVNYKFTLETITKKFRK